MRDRLRAGARNVLLLLGVGFSVYGLAACTETISVIPGEGPILRTDQVSIDMVSIAADGEPLVIEFVGGSPGDLLEVPCSRDYELEVDEQAVPMRIVVWELQPTIPAITDGLRDDVSFVCTAGGWPWQLTYAPVGEATETIVDGTTNEEIPVIVQDAILAPEDLPSGWSEEAAEGFDAPRPPPGHTIVRLTDGTDEVVVTASWHADADAELDRFRTIPEPENAATPAPDPYDIETLMLRGDEALLESDASHRRLRFAEGNYLYSLAAPATVELETLIAIAEGLE